jgi:hypothetical protein
MTSSITRSQSPRLPMLPWWMVIWSGNSALSSSAELESDE